MNLLKFVYFPMRLMIDFAFFFAVLSISKPFHSEIWRLLRFRLWDRQTMTTSYWKHLKTQLFLSHNVCYRCFQPSQVLCTQFCVFYSFSPAYYGNNLLKWWSDIRSLSRCHKSTLILRDYLIVRFLCICSFIHFTTLLREFFFLIHLLREQFKISSLLSHWSDSEIELWARFLLFIDCLIGMNRLYCFVDMCYYILFADKNDSSSHT